ncbi:C39 family peptidase [Thiohalophilus sp.]|uniref:C39 family peptidase n=1 Tax=Thiohalophilus sp. TaxID=3028392 RepID=UPI002ACE8D8F|nr:C39 family peptidase [Thiohalophilus sp.]MDZ7662953.1 C39 family peptidase [Thiohalophilus sp.]
MAFSGRRRRVLGSRKTLAFLVASVLLLTKPLAATEPVRSLYEARTQHVILQQWDLSCGAAALATVLRYQHSEPVTERSVALGLIDREEYIENPRLVRLRQGFSLFDMKQFVDGLGYQGIGLGQLTYTDLLERAPIIVPVDLRGYPHFVVFRGATQQTVLVADPAFGNLSVSREKFIEAWIDYPELGQVGFIVTKDGDPAPPNRLAVYATDFTIVR